MPRAGSGASDEETGQLDSGVSSKAPNYPFVISSEDVSARQWTA